ncbi:MAG: hypothetical protein NW220_07770 [Leptolyngbyaceae cyanobacterium bins.349]|nr:hypothetical protein [Leptolyngbyaceae cyanobacterium bins.349]
MKRILYTITLVLTSFATLPVTLSGASLQTTAQATEAICEPTTRAAVTGGAIQQQINAIARCQSSHLIERVTETSHFTQKNTLNQPNPILANPQNEIDENRLFCPSIPLNASPDDLQYKLALERCKYGA